MIVPTDEIDASMGCTQLAADEYLVKYFEDSKYSKVRGNELRAFDTGQRPYTDFAAGSPAFLKDKAIRGALLFLKTGHVQAKFQWRKWQSGSDAVRLPFALAAEEEEDDDDNEEEPPAGPAPAKDEAPAKDAASADAGGTGDSADDTPLAAILVPDATALPESDDTPPTSAGTPLAAQAQAHAYAGLPPPLSASASDAGSAAGAAAPPPLASARPRRTRHQKPQPQPQPPAANGMTRRRRQQRQQPSQEQQQQQQQQQPPEQQQQQQQQQQQPRQAAKAPARRAQKRQRPAASTPPSDAASRDTPAGDAPAGDGAAAIVAVIKELEDVQEEYRIFHALVRQAAKDLWLELGNEWPPSAGTSTRFGKRRKAA